MRIVGGQYRGKQLASPRSDAIRPTSDRLRETLFNVLAHAYGDPVRDARVADLFAGTGALGLEALSRGARFVLFVDEGAEARGLIRSNIDGMGLGGRTRLFRRDATKLGAIGPTEPFSLVFLDPPYAKGYDMAALKGLTQGWLHGQSLVMLERGRGEPALAAAGYDVLDSRTYGAAEVIFLTLSEVSA
eukprot:gene55781-biopygen46096